METLPCKYCGFSVLVTYYYCPNCGKKLKEPPLSTSIGRQIYIYALSLILPPLGLWPGIKYLRQDNIIAKRIGIIAIVLTIISTILTIWITIGLLSNPLGGNAGDQMQQLQNLGY